MRNGVANHFHVASLTGAGITPLMVDPTNLLLWLRADQGLTLSSASCSNDTLASWALAGIGSRTGGQTDPGGGTSAIRLTETNDGAGPAIVHQISNGPTNQQTGPAFFDVPLKQGTRTWVYVQFAGAGSSAYLNLATAAAGTLAGVTVRLLSGAAGDWQVWRVAATNATAGNMAIRLATGDGVSSYIGDGTGTLFVGTGSTFGPVLTQDRVSQWSDQGPAGNHVTQATPGSQMLFRCLDGAGLWVPSTALTNREVGIPINAEKSLLLPAAFYDAFDGTASPITLIAVVRRVAALGGDSFGIVRLTGAAARRDIGQVDSATNAYQQIHVGDDATAKTWLSSRSAALTYHSVVSRIDTVENLTVDGVLDPLSPRDVAVGLQSFTGGIIGANQRLMREVAVYRSTLSAADARRVENGMRVRAGLAPI